MRRLAVCEFSTLNASFEDDLDAYAAAGFDGISICELSTFPASFEEDLAAYSAAGADGISIFERKLVAGRESEQLEAFRAWVGRWRQRTGARIEVPSFDALAWVAYSHLQTAG